MKNAAKASLAIVLVALGLLGVRELYTALAPPEAPARAAGSVAPIPAPIEPPDAPVVPASPAGEDGDREAVESAERAGSSPAPAGEAAPSRTLVTARAVDERGLALAGARLWVVTEEGEARDFPASEASGDDGRLELELPEGASYRYVGRELANAHLACRAPAKATAFFVGTVERGETRDQGDLTLAPGGGAAGRVLDDTGMPASGARVVATPAQAISELTSAMRLGPEKGRAFPATRTDEAGGFALEGLPVGDARVWSHMPGFLWTISEPLGVLEGSLELCGDLTLVRLSADERVLGRVVDPSGVPVAGVDVLYRRPRSWAEERRRSGSNGRFAIDVLQGGSLELLAEDPDGRFGPSPLVTAEAGGDEVELALSPRGELVLQVYDEHGEPLEKAWAMAIPGAEGEAFAPNPGAEFEHSDETGRLVLVALPGSFRANVGHRQYEAQKIGPFDATALPAEAIEIRLERPPVLSGVVLAGGVPVAGAKVGLGLDHPWNAREITHGFPMRFSASNIPDVETDEEGRFAISTEPDVEATCVLVVRHEGYATSELALPGVDPKIGAGDLRVHLRGGGSLEGRVFVPPTRSPGGVVVAASRGDGLPLVTRTDGSGRYRLDELSPGPWRVEYRPHEPEGRVHAILSPEEAPYDWNVEIREGETSHLDIDIRWHQGLTCDGSLSIDGEGAAGWSAVLTEPDHADRPYDLQPVTLGSDGHFRAPAYPGPGKLVLRSPVGSQPASTIEVEVRVEPQQIPIELEFRTGTLVGSLEGGPRSLRAGIGIGEGRRLTARFETERDGTFRIERMPAGRVSILHMTEGDYGPGWYPLGDVTVVAGESVRFEPSR